MGDSMTNAEINRYIHFAILDNCTGVKIVPYGKSGSGTLPCEHAKADAHTNPHPPVPNYCSDDSPRWLLNEAMKVQRRRIGLTAIIAALETIVQKRVDNLFNLKLSSDAQDWYAYELLDAGTEQLARALVEADLIVAAHKA